MDKKEEKYENLKKNSFANHPERINKKGRGKSISLKREMSKILKHDGKITFKGDQIIAMGERKFNKSHKESWVTVKVPNEMLLAMKLLKMATGDPRSPNTFQSLKLLLEQYDGKPMQNVDISSNGKEILQDIKVAIINNASHHDTEAIEIHDDDKSIEDGD